MTLTLDPAGTPVDLTNCEREPIHIPGAVQPHGVLFACDRPGPDGAALVVRQVSGSVEAHFGVVPAAILGQPLASLFDAGSNDRLEVAALRDEVRSVNPVPVTSLRGETFDAILHRPEANPDLVIVETEPQREGHVSGTFHPRMRESVVRLQSATTVDRLSKIAAEEVRAITGFDRVMVYRFDADWNGVVVAEAKRDDIGSFLGQHYPASDIPAQARKLYTLNWLRFIADVSYRPSPITPPRAAPLDLSFSVLRSVSPIHIEYLQNMRVTASMSVSLVIDGQLAGLIACHHYAGPRFVPYAVRETAEYLGQTLSWHLRVVEGADAAREARVVKTREADVVAAMATSDDLLDALATPALVGLTEASSAAVVLDEGMRIVGANAPSEDEVRSIVDWLRTTEHEVFATDHLAQHVPGAAGWDDRAAGLVAVAVSRELGEYLLWFRPSSERIVEWAGAPFKVEMKGTDGGVRLSPRGSFERWREEVRGRSEPWQIWQVDGASSLRRVMLGGVRTRAAALRDANQRLVDADRAKDDFIATVSHELRTPLNAISGWTGMMRGGRLTQAKQEYAIEVIARNALLQTQLIEDLLDVSRITSGKLTLDVDVVDLVGLAENAIESVALAAEAKAIRVKSILDSKATPVLGDVTRLRQVVSNLLGNAIKFTPKNGSITVALRRLESDVELSIADTGQGIDPEFLPFLFDLFRQQDSGMNRRSQGLGIGLAIAKKLVEMHGGRIAADSDGPGKGSTFSIRLPVGPLRPTPVSRRGETIPKRQPPAELAGLTVLVVEDETDSRDFVVQMLETCGAKVTPSSNADEALRALAKASTPPDVIVSDIGLPGVDGFQLMRAIRDLPAEKGGRIPAIALSAYTRAVDRTSALTAGFHAHLPKPVDASELVAVIVSLVDRDKR